MQIREWLTLALVTFIIITPLEVSAECKTACECSSKPRIGRSYRQGRWFVVETDNFQICCEGVQAPAQELARHAESLRKSLSDKWLGDELAAPWIPKCQIALYSSQQSYVSAAGRGSERTVGSSLVNVAAGRITGRRIDLLGDGTSYLSAALPHELTHVVLKDRFPTAKLPRWADEGTAILADSQSKQARHLKDLKNSFARGATFHAAALLTMDGYPETDKWGVFYGQSVSLVRFLSEQKTSVDFVEFIEKANSAGYDGALKECYGIKNANELDRQWRLSIKTTL